MKNNIIDIYLESAKMILKRGHCSEINCQGCFISRLGLYNTPVCMECEYYSYSDGAPFITRKSLRGQVLAAKYIADHEEEKDG